jgi:uncharacterized protein (TIGR03066 family)
VPPIFELKSTAMKKLKLTKKRTPQPTPIARPTSGFGRIGLLVIPVLLLTAGGTWAILEFVVWNRLPSELVGRWEVIQGPREYKDAVFEFYRSGKMIGYLNENEKVGLIKADIRIEGDKIYSTTTNPQTGKEHVSVQTIRTLTAREFVVEDSKGIRTHMRRIE